jgi:hypothetical protein
MVPEDSFPRDLSPLENNLLLWLLPADRSGYREYRPLLETWKVAAKGRRGGGNFILAPGTATIDIESPLPQVFAHGVVETADGAIAVTIRERFGDQLEFEIVNLGGESLPDIVGEKRRWTYSLWLPKQACPICLGSIREVTMLTGKGRTLVLALCKNDERIWVYDDVSGVNHPIPLTNFYNELMLHANVRDPHVALNSKRLFSDLHMYSDVMLSRAFGSYNKLKTKIVFEDNLQVPGERTSSWFNRLLLRNQKPE